jgi:hypothetical protein
MGLTPIKKKAQQQIPLGISPGAFTYLRAVNGRKP